MTQATQTLLCVSPQKLPEEARALLDPSQPAPSQFWPYRIEIKVQVALICLFVPFYACILLAKSVMAVLFVLIGCTTPIVFLGKMVRTRLDARQQQKTGTWRYGLFLTPDALLWRTQENDCFFFPKAEIRKIATLSRGTIVEAVELTLPDGDYVQLSLLDLGNTSNEFAKALLQWHKG
jgi:hypothetical protein